MATAQWAVDFAQNIVEFLAGHGIEGLTGTVIRDVLAEHIDDEIPGYCDDCDQKDGDDRAREPSASDEARHYGEDRG
ncbi:MAG: hypothetical protein KAX31_02585 [Thermoplasmata archaeon]|nr:hypothetical protein [Thermoplasmata archaeon]